MFAIEERDRERQTDRDRQKENYLEKNEYIKNIHRKKKCNDECNKILKPMKYKKKT